MNTQEQLDSMVKTVKDLTEAAVKAQQESNTALEKRIEERLQAALATHDGFKAERKIKFVEGSDTDEIVGSMKKDMQEDLDRVYLMSQLLRKPVATLKSWDRWKKRAGDLKKALDASTAGEGLEWVPTGFSSQLIEKVVLQLKVGALFETIVMPSNPYTLPIELADIETTVHPEQTADTGQTNMDKQSGAGLTGNLTFTAKAHVAEMLMSKEIQEDSIIPVMPLVERRLVRALARGREDFMVNGDTTSTHMDSDTTASNSRRKNFMGLRGLGYQNSYTTDLATLAIGNLLGMRENMGVYGIDPNQLAFVTSMKGYIKCLRMGDEVMTLEKYGPNAVILSGELAKVGGIPLIVSEKYRSDLNSSGVYASGETKTGLSLVYRPGLMTGVRRDVETQVLVEKYAESRQDAVLVSERVAFRDTYPIASNRTLEYGVNVG